MPNQALASLGIVFVLFSAYTLLHLFIFRAFRPVLRWQVLRTLFLAFSPVVVLTAWAVERKLSVTPDFYAGPSWSYVLAAAVLLWLLHVGYLIFFNSIGGSLSVRTSCDFYQSKNLAITLPELLARYDIQDSYLRRLEILKASGLLMNTGNGSEFRLTPKGIFLATAVRWLKNLYKLGPGG